MSMMDKDELIARKELLLKSLAEQKKELEQIRANIFATDGALQEVEFWLSKFDKGE